MSTVNATAVVVRWRGGDEIARCLRSLLDHGGPRLMKIVLVDSGSGDGGAERLASVFPEVEVVALEENRSFAHAANTGARRCTEELLLLLNPDTEVEEGAITTLAEAIEERPRSAGVVPTLVNPDGSSQHLWQLRRLPTVARLAVGRAGASAFSSPPESETTVAQPAAAAWMVRRDVWQALGGFDEAFAPAWWEDVDFCARLGGSLEDSQFPTNEGFIVIPRARIRHMGGSSVRELADAAFLTAYYANLLRYAARHHPERFGLISHALRWSLVGRAAIHQGRRRAYLQVTQNLGGDQYR